MTFLQTFQHGSDGRPRHGIAGRGEYSRMESLNFGLTEKARSSSDFFMEPQPGLSTSCSRKQARVFSMKSVKKYGLEVYFKIMQPPAFR